MLSFYFQPDLCAGSFRASALVEQLNRTDLEVEVVTTATNRYSSFEQKAESYEVIDGIHIHRISLPTHNSGMYDQILAFFSYYRHAMKITKNSEYEAVFATSSRLFTAFLGARIASKKGISLYLDIRDIFVDTMSEILPSFISVFATTLGALIARQKKNPLYLDIRDIFVDTLSDVLPRGWALILAPIFSVIEKLTFSTASKINFVSEGFRPYFESRYPGKSLSFFTNGIDNDSVWYPQFGLRIPNKVIEIQQKCAKSKILFTWENTVKS